MNTFLPHFNASLNGLATLLLLLGFWLIKQRREAAHRWVMLAAFAVSTAFLASYLYYHIVVKQGISTPFPQYPPTAIRLLYYFILLSHIILAATVPVLALLAIWWGWRDQRVRHRKVGKIAWPIWLYVSITGVAVYVMLYQLYPPESTADKLESQIQTGRSSP